MCGFQEGGSDLLADFLNDDLLPRASGFLNGHVGRYSQEMCSNNGVHSSDMTNYC